MKPSFPHGPAQGTQSVQRALAILNTFETGQMSFSAAELAQRLDLKTPTVHRLVNALIYSGFMAQDRETGKYTIGPAALRLGLLAESSENILSSAERLIHEFWEEYSESVSLHTRIGEQRMCLKELESSHPVKAVSGVGKSYPVSSGAAGKALVAFSEDWQELPPEDSRHLTTAQWRSELEEVRSRGYALSFGETLPGAHAVAVPFAPTHIRLRMCINITGPSDRLPEERLHEIGRLLKQKINSYRG